MPFAAPQSYSFFRRKFIEPDLEILHMIFRISSPVICLDIGRHAYSLWEYEVAHSRGAFPIGVGALRLARSAASHSFLISLCRSLEERGRSLDPRRENKFGSLPPSRVKTFISLSPNLVKTSVPAEFSKNRPHAKKNVALLALPQEGITRLDSSVRVSLSVTKDHEMECTLCTDG
ncbi:hypothetical protein Tco_1067291 [Tanacetum coccineum]|uniref:Uncharacterized protein n=1 Tax=Tanacetum coccineum TaxID=301880 RepID=A0ABQ5HDP4_9ASTR